jgi:hypothetical protein
MCSSMGLEACWDFSMSFIDHEAAVLFIDLVLGSSRIVKFGVEDFG